MSNRPESAIKWSRSVQAMVSDYTANSLKEMSREAGTTVSSMARIILQQAFENESAHKANWLKGVKQERQMLRKEHQICNGKKPKADSKSC